MTTTPITKLQNVRMRILDLTNDTRTSPEHMPELNALRSKITEIIGDLMREKREQE